MFTNILIGIDGRAGGRDAVALARLLAAPDASLTLAHVCAPFLGRGAAEAIVMEREDARRLLEHERELAAVPAGLVVSGPGPVGPGLHALADDGGADLLVVGATRHNLVGRVVAGDDSRAALDRARCAVAVAPSGYSQAPHRLRRIGVGYDASPGGDRALGAARDLAGLHGGDITLLWVIAPEDLLAENPIPASWPREPQDLMDRDTERIAQLEGVHGVVARGDPRDALVRFSRDVDVLLVGSSHHRPLDRFVHGTVTNYLARHTACPVVVMSPETVSCHGPDGEFVTAVA